MRLYTGLRPIISLQTDLSKSRLQAQRYIFFIITCVNLLLFNKIQLLPRFVQLFPPPVHLLSLRALLAYFRSI